jgi:hypothetical protein
MTEAKKELDDAAYEAAFAESLKTMKAPDPPDKPYEELTPEEKTWILIHGYRSSTDGKDFKFVALDDLEDQAAEPD